MVKNSKEGVPYNITVCATTLIIMTTLVMTMTTTMMVMMVLMMIMTDTIGTNCYRSMQLCAKLQMAQIWEQKR